MESLDKDFEYNDLLVPTYMRKEKKGYIVSLFGSGMGEEYLYLKQLLGGTVNILELEITSFNIDDNIKTTLKEQLTLDDFKETNFKNLKLSEDMVLNAMIHEGIASYLIDINKGNKTFNLENTYENLIDTLGMFSRTFKNIDMKILGTKVVYYGDLAVDIVEYLKYLTHLGLDVIYLSSDLVGSDYFKSISVLHKKLGMADVNTTLSDKLNSVTVFKTRSKVSVDKLIVDTSSNKYTTIVRRLSNSLFDFSGLYDIEVNYREYYERDEVNMKEYLPVYACNIVGYKEEEFAELVQFLFKVENTIYIKYFKDILLDASVKLGNDGLSEMGASIDYKELKVIEGSKFFREYNTNYVNTLLYNISQAMQEENIDMLDYDSKKKCMLRKCMLRNVLYSLLEHGVSLDSTGKITKYIINNYNGLMNNNTEFRVLIRTLLYCGKDVVILSAKGEIDGFTNIVLGEEIYTISGENGLLCISLKINDFYNNRNKKESLFNRVFKRKKKKQSSLLDLDVKN